MLFSKPKPDIKRGILDKAEQNATTGLIQAKLELRHHTLLLEQLPDSDSEEAQREIRLTKEAIERDHKSIKNWETQLRAIQYERNT